MDQVLYRFYDDEDRLLYVGITGDWHKRFHQHEKDAGWFGLAVRCTFERFETRDLVIEAETKAITNEFPIYNKDQNPDYENSVAHFQRIKFAVFGQLEIDELHKPLMKIIWEYLDFYKMPRKKARYVAFLWFSAYSTIDKTEMDCRNCEALFGHRMYRDLARQAREEYNNATN
jgi:predicted GIY-YIG superfamily endonuclease